MTTKKVLIFILIIASLATGSFIFREDLKPLFNASNEFITNDPSINSMKRDVGLAKQRIFTPDEPPLRKEDETPSKLSKLTVQGVITESNRQRELANLTTLKGSDLLNKAAELKIDDMLNRQYFEHISPLGDGPSQLADKSGYEFVIIGENLALGNFKDDQDLVAGWMASPGHRENILKNSYKEIGVAVREGMFEGQMTWLAVQEFGTPASTCAKPDKILSTLIDNNKTELNKQEFIINDTKIKLDAYQPKTDSTYAKMIQDYNILVERYNALANETKIKVGEFNSQAEIYNFCLKQFNEE